MPLTESPIKEFPSNRSDGDGIKMNLTHESQLVVRINSSQLTQIGNHCNINCRAGQGKLQTKDNNKDLSDTDQDCDIQELPKRQTRRSKKRRKPKPACALTKPVGCAELSSSDRAFVAMSDDIMMAVQSYRDNGQWTVFDYNTRLMSVKYSGNNEAQIIIQLEKSMALCYQNKLEQAEQMILEAEGSIAAVNSANAATLIRRCRLYKSGVYRKTLNQIGLAYENTTAAEQTYTGHTITLDDTFIVYERACVLMDFATKCPCRNKDRLIEQAKACLKQCIEWSMVLEQDDSNTRYIKKNHFALIKIAMLVLDCRTTAGRQKSFSDDSAIKEARNCLDTLYQRYWNGIAMGEKVQYYLAEADLYWRQKDYQQAKLSATKAHDMAVLYGFETEVNPATARLEEINEAMLTGEVNPCQYTSHVSDGELADMSSSCESLSGPLTDLW